MVFFGKGEGKAQPVVAGPIVLGVVVIDEVEIGEAVPEDDFFKSSIPARAPSASAEAGRGVSKDS